ncbi:MAG: response regulator [Bacteroidetes bacterium]|nr:response regulator [Bacteroidota bacterium]
MKILIVVGLGKFSGLELLKHINEKNTQTKIIMLTNYNEPFYQRRCAELGADFFIDKTTEFEKLPEILKTLFNAPISIK